LKKTRIGFDGRALCDISQYRGDGRYTACLVDNLVRLGEEYRFVLFGYRKSFDPRLLEEETLKKIEWQEIPLAGRLPCADITANHILFARAVNGSGLSLFHSIDHNMTPFLKCPSIVTVHDLILLILRGPYLGPKSYFWIKAQHRATLKASLIVTISETTRRDVERLWSVPKDRIEVVYEGVNERYKPISDEKKIDEILRKYGIKKPYFLYVGGFDPRKNILNTLLGFKRFLKNHGGYYLAMCGDPVGFEDYIHDEIEDLGLSDRIILTGNVPHNDLPFIYSAATALVLISQYEGFGLPVLESLACGTPVLLSREGSLLEIAGDAGLYVDLLEPDRIAEVMALLAFDERIRGKLREKGLRRASKFTWDEAARKILGLYSRVIRATSH